VLSRSRVVKCLIKRDHFFAAEALKARSDRRTRAGLGPHCGASPRADATWPAARRGSRRNKHATGHSLSSRAGRIALVVGLLIIAALALGALVMVKIANSDPMKLEALRSHMIGGVFILLLMLVRFFVRARTKHPAPASTGSPVLDRLAWVSHRLFYVAVLGMAGSGIVMALQTGLPAIVFDGGGVLPVDFWVFPIRTVHYLFSRVLMALIALHVAGALYHTLILKDGLLRRMFFGRRILHGTDSETTLNQALSEVRR
jgi:cytochrome b561